jgi:hypothetical protein
MGLAGAAIAGKKLKDQARSDYYGGTTASYGNTISYGTAAAQPIPVGASTGVSQSFSTFASPDTHYSLKDAVMQKYYEKKLSHKQKSQGSRDWVPIAEAVAAGLLAKRAADKANAPKSKDLSYELIDAAVKVKKRGWLPGAYQDMGLYTTLRVDRNVLLSKGLISKGDRIKALLGLGNPTKFSLENIVNKRTKNAIKEQLGLSRKDSIKLEYISDIEAPLTTGPTVLETHTQPYTQGPLEKFTPPKLNQPNQVFVDRRNWGNDNGDLYDRPVGYGNMEGPIDRLAHKIAGHTTASGVLADRPGFTEPLHEGRIDRLANKIVGKKYYDPIVTRPDYIRSRDEGPLDKIAMKAVGRPSMGVMPASATTLPSQSMLYQQQPYTYSTTQSRFSTIQSDYPNVQTTESMLGYYPSVQSYTADPILSRSVVEPGYLQNPIITKPAVDDLTGAYSQEHIGGFRKLKNKVKGHRHRHHQSHYGDYYY